MILVNKYVKTFKTDIIVFICDFIMCLMSHYEQIDLLTLCNTGHYSCSIDDHHYGVNLIDEVICMEFVLLEIWMCFL
jgi:hypothetical protein